MYLVFASTLQASQILSDLAKQNIQAKHIPSMEIEPDLESITQLKQIINDFDYIIFTSPTAIEFASKVLINTKAQYLTVGQMTAKRLAKYINPDKILHPQTSSGVDALIEEVLAKIDLANKKVLLVKGDSDSLRITSYLADKVDIYQEITIYHYKYLPLDLKPLLKITTGIVITSSVEAKYLFAQAKKFGYLEDLLLLPFVTIHQNIFKLLKSYGVSNVILKQILLPDKNLS